MSRTSFAVVKLRSTAPPLRAQASAVRRDRATFSVMSPPGSGQERRLVMYRSSSSSPQFARVLPPVPRGSSPTRSYAPAISFCSAAPFCVSRCTPALPGPPGITINVPRLASGRSLRKRETARVSCGPAGSA